jgi:hypothetical protein
MKISYLTSLSVGFILWSGVSSAVMVDYPHLIGKSMAAVKHKLIKVPQLSEEVPPLKPIRQAPAKVRIGKLIYIKEGMNFNVKFEDVCQTTMNVNVYDLRGQTNPTLDLGEGKVNCPSTMGGEPVQVYVLGTMALANDNSFAGEPPSDVKFFSAALFISSPKIDDSRFNFKYFMTKEIGLNSGMLPLTPDVGVHCSRVDDNTTDCSAQYPESFSAMVDFEDGGQ